MARPEARRLAQALRTHSGRSVQRHARRSLEGVVLDLEPLRLDVAGIDAELTDDDVTIGRALARHLDDEPLEVGDTLVLVEVANGDYDAIDVLEGS